MFILRLIPTIDVHTPLGYGKAIAWLDYGEDVNTVWKVQLYSTGAVFNVYDDDIRIYPNKMNGENIVIPDKWIK